jgi:hypothetical protein
MASTWYWSVHPSSSTILANTAATRVSPARGLPPFAMRPTTTPTSIRDTSPYRAPPSDQLSPLHSSSSSSGTETGTGGSYYNFGAIPDTLDPFSRFWGKLDNMLDDISNPVAFATASMGAGPAGAELTQGAGDGEGEGEKRERRRTSERRKTKDKEKEQGRGAYRAASKRAWLIVAESPGSFYLVNKHNVPRDSNGSSSRTSCVQTPCKSLTIDRQRKRPQKS